MAVSFAVFTTHPGLLRCQLSRLQGQIVTRTDRADAVGVGTFSQEEVLLRRFGPAAQERPLGGLLEDGPSEALLYQAQLLGPSRSIEDDAQPLRFRQWLFALDGVLPEFGRFSSALSSALPEYLRQNLRADTEAQAALALFIAGLRELGRIDDGLLEPSAAAALLGRTARALSRWSADAGASRTPELRLFATNARLLVAARLGARPLHYALLEGTDSCPTCGITPATPELRQEVRAHRRCRTVAVATEVRGGKWLELESGEALAVGPNAELTRIPF